MRWFDSSIRTKIKTMKQETYKREILIRISLEIPVQHGYTDEELLAETIRFSSVYPEVKIEEVKVETDETEEGLTKLSFVQIYENYFSTPLLNKLKEHISFVSIDHTDEFDKEFFVMVANIEEHILPTYTKNSKEWSEVKNLMRLIENFQYLHVTAG